MQFELLTFCAGSWPVAPKIAVRMSAAYALNPPTMPALEEVHASVGQLEHHAVGALRHCRLYPGGRSTCASESVCASMMVPIGVAVS